MSTASIFSSTEPGSLQLAESAPPPSHSIVSRTVLATPELRVVLFSFAAGQALTEHTSTSRAVIQVLSGAGEFTLAGEPRQLRAGDLLHMPPKLAHAVVATEPMTMLLTLAPERAKEAGKR
jgi:quercetin dioxygenase-like cupin family protein